MAHVRGMIKNVITVEQAVRLILNQVSPLSAEAVPILQARDRVLCENLRAGRNVPPFANSAMDGYAVRWQDVAGAGRARPVVLPVLEEVPAGYVARKTVRPRTAIKIMTGACLPRGADTIVRVEYTEPLGKQVRIFQVDGRGSHIRKAGEDIRKGRVIVEKGRVLVPADVGLMASVGRGRVRVYRRPRVALISTGDELLEINDPPKPGKIVNSNGYTLCAALQEIGALAVSGGIVKDKRRSLAGAFRKALGHDVVITSGGVSVGDYDMVKEALEDVGVRMRFWKVAQRPGHPMAFGRLGKKPVFGLPGNPVSALVSFILYVRPALLKMMGHRRLFLPVVEAVLEQDVKKSSGLKEFVRCRLRTENGQLLASSTGTQSSGVLRSLSLAQGLMVGHEEVTFLGRGSRVPIILLGHQREGLQEELGF